MNWLIPTELINLQGFGYDCLTIKLVSKKHKIALWGLDTRPDDVNQKTSLPQLWRHQQKLNPKLPNFF